MKDVPDEIMNGIEALLDIELQNISEQKQAGESDLGIYTKYYFQVFNLAKRYCPEGKFVMWQKFWDSKYSLAIKGTYKKITKLPVEYDFGQEVQSA